MREQRIELIKLALKEREIILCIDETGDKKKGKSTDYVARQYIGNLGKTENGIVSVNAYGVLEGITFPLIFKIFKPKSRLQEKDIYKTKPRLAIEIIHELIAMGFKLRLVLADSLYGESGDFIEALNQHQLQFVVAIRSNHGVWMPQGWRVRYTRWKKFERIFSNGNTQVRYIREIVFGKRRHLRYWQITTDPVELPENCTWFIMTNLVGDIQKSVGNNYGLRTWIEYGFKQAKDELGWADYRVTNYQTIERWWEIVCSAYLMVSLQSKIFKGADARTQVTSTLDKLEAKFRQHQWWDEGQGWKNILNNLRLIIQPVIFFHLITPWLKVFQIPMLKQGFFHLINIMNKFNAYVPDG
ncbi:MAG: IS701 family transposase [Coleofasciculus sp. Co-bin14]|nr:IS701 family transposase [Coleofasciculus sp. Co-bin14]